MRVVSALTIVGSGIASILVLLSSSKPWGNRIGAALVLSAGALFIWLIALRPHLHIEEGVVTVVGPIRTNSFPLADLKMARGGRFLTLVRRDETYVRVWAVQNTNITLFLGSEGRTERVARDLNFRFV